LGLHALVERLAEPAFKDERQRAAETTVVKTITAVGEVGREEVKAL
jgi:hypothetical protein